MAAGDDPLFDKLRRLRRETKPKPAKEPPPSRDLPVWLKRKLAAKAAKAEEATEGTTMARQVDPPADLEEHDAGEGVFAARHRTFPADYVHGDWRLDEVDQASMDTIAFAARDRDLALLDLRRAVYLDIETTGLSGGAGTIPFQVGLLTFTEAGEVHVWQGLLRGPEEERAMLAETARRIATSAGVVSFFGKSFDRHRLEDKMRVHGIDPPFADRPHLDLYHPLRRLYGEAYVNSRLSTMETELCGLHRPEDLPGRFAPEAWFDFLGGRAHRLEGVLQHNLDDVLSLVTLAAHLGRSLDEKRADGSALSGPDLWRARGLSRLAESDRDRDAALDWSERALARDPDAARPWRLRHADLLRLAGRWEEALPRYDELITEAEDEIAARALLETAKVVEHRVKDRAKALDAVHRARRLVERHVIGRARNRMLEECEQRKVRLEQE